MEALIALVQTTPPYFFFFLSAGWPAVAWAFTGNQLRVQRHFIRKVPQVALQESVLSFTQLTSDWVKRGKDCDWTEKEKGEANVRNQLWLSGCRDGLPGVERKTSPRPLNGVGSEPGTSDHRVLTPCPVGEQWYCRRATCFHFCVCDSTRNSLFFR